jgi:uncharacterized protein YdhG (YjbR/CyaY superfamily)
MPKRKRAADPEAVTAYIEASSEAARARLHQLRAVIREEAPAAIECMAYGLPTWHQGEHLIHLGAFEHHVGVYPGPEAIRAFSEDLSDFRTSKGAIQIPHAVPLPTDLIRRIARWRIDQGAS